MNEETMESKIVKYNHVKDKMPGIQLEDLKWYNATERTEKYVTALKDKVGCRVQIQHTDRNISFVKLLEEKAQAPAQPPRKTVTVAQFSNYQDQDRNDMIIRQTCVKAAAELAKIKGLSGELEFYLVCKRMEKYIHTGE
jgi:hypothetical protein